jgi:hypothetical protein
MMHFPVVLKRQSAELPPLAMNETRLLVADNGMFVERRGPMYTTCTRVMKVDLELDDHSQFCRLNLGRLPRVLHRAMLAFFRYAHEVHGGEAALVLLFHPEKRRFRFYCPLQTVEVFETHRGWYTSDYIEFENPLELPPGYVQIGDAHLHPGSPHPSVMDVNDDQDGLHIIVGNIAHKPSYNIDFVMDGVRFRVAPGLFFQDPDCQPGGRPPEKWLKQIRIRRTQFGQVAGDDTPGGEVV